jgi:hypothetical protein
VANFIAIDPSGNFNEGKGITGYAIFKDNILTEIGDIRSENYNNQMDYWKDILELTKLKDFVVCESYKLQPTKSMAQSWSTLETPQLIGALRYYCWQYNTPIIFQDPSSKVRFSDEILIKLGTLERKNKLYLWQGLKTNDHMRDAMRHGLYYLKYRK